MENNIIEEIRGALTACADEKTRTSSDRFFKQGEAALVHGVGMKEVGRIGKAFFRQIEHCPKEKIFGVCEELWQSRYLEEAVVACIFSESLHKRYEPADFRVFEGWVERYVSNWAACDTLCNHTVGRFVTIYPEFLGELKRWAGSPGRWMKRAATVTLIVPARKGLFLNDIFGIADILLTDKDDMVQKGYGWMLKAASEAYEREVFDYVVSHKAVMPRTALRYAIEKMPAELRAEVMRR